MSLNDFAVFVHLEGGFFVACGAAETQTDRRASTFSLIGPGTGKTVELGTIGPDVDIGPKQSA